MSSPLFEAVVKGNAPEAVSLVKSRLESGQTPQEILEQDLIPAMGEAGRLFDESEYFVPDLLMSAKAMKEAMSLLDPLLKQSGIPRRGTVIIGTVQGDHHDIGKNLVASMLEGNGFTVVDLGINTSADRFVKAVRDTEGKIIVALSALLTITMPQMKVIIDRLTAEGLRDRVRVIIGGAPVTESFAKEINADGYSDSANAAVLLASRLI